MRSIILGIIASFFFATTFVFNRAMELSGGSWIWSASLRYLFMIPFLIIIVLYRKNLRALIIEMRKQPRAWLLWSFIGFGMFYAPLCFAAAYEPGWLISGTWQITIISGTLLVPFFYDRIQTENGVQRIRKRIPLLGLMMSFIILCGIGLMQVEQANHIEWNDILLGVIPVVIASFAYPLGNRKMMELCEGRLDAYQRVLGMTLASLPLWLILSTIGLFTVGVPSGSQTAQSLLVAICSGVIATVLFFQATDLVRGSTAKLAAVEATQSLEVLFALLGEVLLLSALLPSGLSGFGIALLIIGMILHSIVSNRKPAVIPSEAHNAVEQ